MVNLVDELRGNAFEDVCGANEHVRNECLKGNCNCVWHLRQKAADEIERLREALAMIVEGDAEIVKLEGGVNLLKAGPWGLIARAAVEEAK